MTNPVKIVEISKETSSCGAHHINIEAMENILLSVNINWRDVQTTDVDKTCEP